MFVKIPDSSFFFFFFFRFHEDDSSCCTSHGVKEERKDCEHRKYQHNGTWTMGRGLHCIKSCSSCSYRHIKVVYISAIFLVSLIILVLFVLFLFLRLELRPFGIDMINIVPGGIQSNISDSGISSFNKLPELKLYKPFQEAIRERAFLSQNVKPIPAETFAKEVVSVVLKEHPPAWYSTGRLSTVAAIMHHLPISVKDFLLTKSFMKRNCLNVSKK